MFVRNMVLRWTDACWQPKLFGARVHAQSTGRPVIDRLRMQQSGECQLVTRLTRELFVRARYVSAFCTLLVFLLCASSKVCVRWGVMSNDDWFVCGRMCVL